MNKITFELSEAEIFQMGWKVEGKWSWKSLFIGWTYAFLVIRTMIGAGIAGFVVDIVSGVGGPSAVTIILRGLSVVVLVIVVLIVVGSAETVALTLSLSLSLSRALTVIRLIVVTVSEIHHYHLDSLNLRNSMSTDTWLFSFFFGKLTIWSMNVQEKFHPF